MAQDIPTIVEGLAQQQVLTPEQWAEVTRLLRHNGALEYAQTRARDHAMAARRQLAIFPSSPEREALEALADYVLHRDR